MTGWPLWATGKKRGMDDRYDNRDFEHFVKQNADQYRMFPSEKVWDGIQHTLHTRRRWYGFGLALLLLTTGVVTWVMLLTPSGKQQTADTTTAKTVSTVISQAGPSAGEMPAVHPLASNNPASEQSVADNPETIFFSSVSPDRTQEDGKPVTPVQPSPVTTRISSPISASTADIRRQAAIAKNNIRVSAPSIALKVPIAADDNSIPGEIPAEQTAAEEKVQHTTDPDNRAYPMTIESVLNTYRFQPRKNRMSWQVYLVPTVSYRKLKENMAFIRAARSNGTIPTNSLASFGDVNSLVTHKPDLGFELGFSARYEAHKNIRLISGLQFNVSKYDIRAYTHQSEVATIALSSGGGVNSVSAVTNYRNFGSSNRADWLRNLYVSISAPVGAELVFDSKSHTYGGISATLQPTYILANRSYLISTDYKNYAEVPSLTRRWNLNTSVEVFAGFSGKNVDWRIGPQVRYQALSSFVDKYPVREHLFDFGLKMGVIFKK